MFQNSIFDTTSVVNSLPSIDRSSIFDDQVNIIQYVNNKQGMVWCDRHQKYHKHNHGDDDNTVPLDDGFPFMFLLITIYIIIKRYVQRRQKRTI